MSGIEDFPDAVAKTSDLAIKVLDSGDKLGGFISNISGDLFADSVGLIIGDKVKFWRLSNIYKLIDKFYKECEERGISTPKPIAPKFSIPMIENGSLEENDDLQDIWCRLIVNNSDPNHEFEMRYAFIDIIKNLTFLDAQILELIYNNSVRYSSSYSLDNYMLETEPTEPKILINEDYFVRYTTCKENLLSEIKCEKKQLDISIDNLLRVQCLKDLTLEESGFGLDYSDDMAACSYKRYSLTSLGVAFVEACIT